MYYNIIVTVHTIRWL